MVLNVKKGSFVKTSGAQQIDVGFLPKALILFGKNTLSTGAGAFEAHYGMTVGLSDGTTQCCLVGTSEDNVGTSDSYTSWSTTTVWQTVTPLTGAIGSTGTVAFSGTSFTITWSSATNTPVIQYIALGGDDITNTKVIIKDNGTTSAGNFAYTGVGFQGDFAFFLNSGVFPAASNTASGTGVQIGAATSSTRRWAIASLSEDGSALMDTYSYQRTDRCMMSLLWASGAVDGEADFVSFDTDGFTLNWVDPITVTTIDFAALVIKGGVWEVGNFLQPDATGNSDITLANTSLAPSLAFFASNNLIASTSVQAHNRISIGATTATDQGYAWAGDKDVPTTSENASIDRTDRCIGLHTENVTHTSSTTEAQAQLATNGLATAGKVTLNWVTVADTTDRQLLYFVAGTTGGGPPPPPPNIEQSIWIEWEEA